jgi:hypothetical protein
MDLGLLRSMTWQTDLREENGEEQEGKIRAKKTEETER